MVGGLAGKLPGWWWYRDWVHFLGRQLTKERGMRLPTPRLDRGELELFRPGLGPGIGPIQISKRSIWDSLGCHRQSAKAAGTTMGRQVGVFDRKMIGKR